MTVLDDVVAALGGGGIALLPTDTVYGLAVRPEDDGPVHRLFDLKGRPRGRNLPIMAAELGQLTALGIDVGPAFRALLDAGLMPGALTVATGVREELLPPWLKGRDEVAVRFPDHAFMLEVLRRTGPLLVTSANAHAQATRETVPEILEQLAAPPDVVVDEGPLDVVPSTLLNCRTVPPTIERLGQVTRERIEEVLGDVRPER